MPALPTGTVTFLFTDIAGSTRRWDEQPNAMQHALARHDATRRQLIVTARAALGVETSGAARAAGRALFVEQAIAEALEEAATCEPAAGAAVRGVR